MAGLVKDVTIASVTLTQLYSTSSVSVMENRRSYYGTVNKYFVVDGKQDYRKFLVLSGNNNVLDMVTTRLLWDAPMIPKEWMLDNFELQFSWSATEVEDEQE